MRLGSLRSVPVAASSVQGKPCKARNGRWTGRPHRESPRASVSASPVTIYHNACLKTQSDRLLGNPIPIRDPSGGVFKVYKGDSNAWYEILRDPRGRWIGKIVSTFEAYRLHREWLDETGGDSGKGGGVFLDWAARRVVGEAGTPMFRLFK